MNYNSYKCTFLDENFNSQQILFGGNITFSIVFNKDNTKDLTFSELTNSLVNEGEEISGLDLLWNRLSQENEITDLNFYIYLETEEVPEHKIIEIKSINNFQYRNRSYDQGEDFLFEKTMEIG